MREADGVENGLFFYVGEQNRCGCDFAEGWPVLNSTISKGSSCASVKEEDNDSGFYIFCSSRVSAWFCTGCNYNSYTRLLCTCAFSNKQDKNGFEIWATFTQSV